MSLTGSSIDGYAQSLPIPSLSMITGLLGAALGIDRSQHEQLQAIQDKLRYAAVVHKPGVPLVDYQTADLSQLRLVGPMWWYDMNGDVGVMERTGGDREGTRIQHRPYLADAELTVIVELLESAPSSAEELLQALDEPIRPLHLGRTSCPPSGRIAGIVLDVANLDDAIKEVSPGTAYVPADLTDTQWGDIVMSLPGGRDWRTRRHGGAVMYVVRSHT